MISILGMVCFWVYHTIVLFLPAQFQFLCDSCPFWSASLSPSFRSLIVSQPVGWLPVMFEWKVDHQPPTYCGDMWWYLCFGCFLMFFRCLGHQHCDRVSVYETHETVDDISVLGGVVHWIASAGNLLFLLVQVKTSHMFRIVSLYV